MQKAGRFLKSWGQRVFAFGLVISRLLPSVAMGADLPEPSTLKFKTDGTFKIVAFGDIHWNGNTAEDQQTLQAMDAILTAENPDLVVYTGDNCTSGTLSTMVQGYEQFTAPVVRRGLPGPPRWAITTQKVATLHVRPPMRQLWG
jgi:predicted MPP superfamily phosphohydrolase